MRFPVRVGISVTVCFRELGQRVDLSDLDFILGTVFLILILPSASILKELRLLSTECGLALALLGVLRSGRLRRVGWWRRGWDKRKVQESICGGGTTMAGIIVVVR